MTKIFTFICTPETKDTRLDMFLMKELGTSRNKVQVYITNGQVLVNGKKPKKPGDHLRTDATITVDLKPQTQDAKKKDAKERDTDEYGVRIIAETPDYLIVHKPAGLLVHPTEASEPETLTKWLMERYPEIKKVGESAYRPGIVHRIDKDASGLLVVARNQDMFLHLKKQFQERQVEKYYTVLVHEVVPRDHEVLTFAIDRGHGGRMASRPKTDLTKVKNVTKDQGGKQALTELWVEKRFTRFTLLKVRIHTGRMHQIRVHMLAYNHPVVGDMLYFNKKLNRKRDLTLGRIFLHATELRFTDREGKMVEYSDVLPEKLQRFLEELR